MKSLIIFFGLFLISLNPLFAGLTLEHCEKAAQANYPLINQYRLIDSAKSYSLSNLSKNWLPQINFTAQASYQSDVTKIPFDFASLGLPISIDGISKDQYKAYFDVSQLIWDGGKIKAGKEITEAESAVNSANTDNTLYAVKERIRDMFFGVLTIDNTLKVLDVKESDLKEILSSVESMFHNGTAMQSDLDRLNVELYNLQDNREELFSNRRAICKMLSLFIDEEVNESTIFDHPDGTYDPKSTINRPELSAFNSQISLIKARNNSLNATTKPQLGMFLQGGVGRPALNMLDNDFNFYAIGGIRFSWKLSELYTTDNKKQLLEIDESSVKTQKETFLFNIRQQSEKAQSDILKYRKLLKNDDEIIALRLSILKATESQFKNGVSASLDLVKDLNATEEARLMKALHEVQYLQSIYNYKLICGN